ncbi:MAG TPA: hypothetical protein VMK12_24450, partial [Anaeromyxobacteraceae bacterium]|nr:hypothetical protein [Anaeromyxobacteraceae bacterium]
RGMRALMTVEGATDADVFEAFVERVLLRKLHPGDIDYSPAPNLIEQGWAKLKGALKDFGARTREALDVTIRRAMDLIGADDALAWFTHCGYQAHGI